MQSKFTRNKLKKVFKPANNNPEFDPMTPDKRKYKKPTKKDYDLASIVTAQKMLKAFCWRPWMEDFIDKEGNTLNV